MLTVKKEKMEPKELCKQLANWWWTPHHPSKMVNIWHGPEGREAALNLFWVVNGRTKFDFVPNLEMWIDCNRAVLEEVNGRRVEDYILLLSPAEFYRQVVAENPELFTSFPDIRSHLLGTKTY